MTNLQELLEQGIEQHCAPCAAIYARRGKNDFTLFAGNHTYETAAPKLQPDDLFDLASMTKVFATTTLVMLRVQEHKLNLDAPMTDYLPQRHLNDPTSPTIRQLLAHCAGLPPCVPFHTQNADIQVPAGQDDLIANTPLEYQPGTATKYSDIGFMILGIILQNIDGQRSLAQQFKEDVARPLGLKDATFCPAPELKGRCVPTELIPNHCPPMPYQGVVHDENARWHHGIAGHAGLFSPLQDLATISHMLSDNDGSFLNPKLVSLFTRPAYLLPDSSRCLGWLAHSPLNPLTGVRAQCFAPEMISPETFGHTGFTGTSCWIDPVQDTTVIILTNAVHPLRSCKERYFPWRNELHAAALREC